MCHYSLTTACVLPKEVESTDLVGHRKLSQMFHIALSKFLLVLKTTTTTEALISLKIQVSHYSFILSKSSWIHSLLGGCFMMNIFI